MTARGTTRSWRVAELRDRRRCLGFALDHLFIFTAVGAPEAERLLRCGLTEGERNVHPGQGTANRRLFLRNAMLECLWVYDAPEARGRVIDRMRLWKRWHDRAIGASPFGIALRPLQPTEQDIPFAAWEYRPRNLPQPYASTIATNSVCIEEPMLFYVSFGRRPDATPMDRRQPLEHAIGVREITALRITLRHHKPWSAAVQAVERLGVARFMLVPNLSWRWGSLVTSWMAASDTALQVMNGGSCLWGIH